MPKKPLDHSKEIKGLLYRVCYGYLLEGDIDLAREIREKIALIGSRDFGGFDCPLWLLVIAGGNPENLTAVADIAREELAHELLGTEAVDD